MRRALAMISSVTLTLGLAIGVAPMATAAASPDSVTVGGSVGGPTTLTSASVQAEIGDTFILQDNTLGGPNGFYVQNLTGSVSRGGTSCAAQCIVAGGASTTLTVTAFGTLEVKANGAGIAILTISATGSSGGVAQTPTYTATADANGGTCSGNTSWTRIPSIAAFPGVFDLPNASACTRTGYSLAGWAASANATKADFAPGASYTMSDSDITLYAVWVLNGVEIRYNANVGDVDQCIQGGFNVVGTARESAPTVLSAGSAVAAQAPCSPVGFRLTGWMLSGDGPTVVAPGAALPASFVSGSSYVLFAKWQIVYELTPSPEALSVSSGETVSVTFTATVNGVPAARALIEVVGASVSIAPSGQGVFAAKAMATTDDTGQATVDVRLTGTGSGMVTAAFGDVSIGVPVTVTQNRTITIVGERTTVSGSSGIRVKGVATGLPAGAKVVPWIRFPGQVGFTQGIAQGAIDANGSFVWERKTGKKTYVYFTTQDGSVKSNTVDIEAK